MSIIRGSSRKGNSISGGDNSEISASNKVRRINPIDVDHPEEDEA